MSNIARLVHVLIFSLLSFSIYSEVSPIYQINNVDIRNGLSHSAVLSIHEDKNGFLWIGTYDGLNCYDGISVSQILLENMDIHSGIIHSISDCQDNCLWMSTYMGLHKYSINNERFIESYNKYKDPYKLVTNGNDMTLVLSESGSVDKYVSPHDGFKTFPFLKISPSQIKCSFFDDNNTLWLFTDSTVNKVFFKDFNNNEILDYECKEFSLVEGGKTEYVYKDDNVVYFVTDKGDLYEYDLNVSEKKIIHNISGLMSNYGKISSILNFDNCIFISFKSNGLVRLVPEKNYAEEVIDDSYGMFCLFKDKKQDLLWAGTDGKGVMNYFKKHSLFTTTLTSSLPKKIRKPIRSILEDKNGDLWIGTKGDGLFKISNYDNFANEKIPAENFVHFDRKYSFGLSQVFSLVENKNLDLIWIGADEAGLYYYSYKDNNIHKVINSDNRYIGSIHDIYYEGDSVLWIATQNDGVVKVKINIRGNEIEAAEVDQIIFKEKGYVIKEFFDIEAADEENLWLASRGYGVIKYNKKTGYYKQILTHLSSFSMSDDILCICPYSENVTFFGTSGGILKIEVGKDGSSYVSVYNQRSGLLSEMVHGILTDKTGCLWLSTNKGLTKYNPKNGVSHNYFNYHGLDIVEFSDDAYFKSQIDNDLYFGGIDGFVKIDLSNEVDSITNAPVQFTDLSIDGVDVPINAYISGKCDDRTITLKHNQNNFTIRFIAIDYVRGENIEYSYKLENYDNEWINTNRVNSATFDGLEYGDYVFKVKYIKDVYDNNSQVYSINIKILPPWYKTAIFNVLLYVFLLIIVFVAIFILLRYQKRKTERRRIEMEEKQKAELYDTKMKFFTNITHEFLTPLTLIQGPCDRIINYEKTDDFILKYVNLLKLNADKLQSLIQEILNFQRFEELGQYNQNIRCISINKLLDTIKYQYSEICERKNVTFNIEVPDKTLWNTDVLCLNKIIGNLVSNAIKYVNDNGYINITVSINDNNHLLINVYNTGNGIKSNELDSIFNRFKVIDNFSSGDNNEFRYQNGLGLHICYYMVNILGGNISVDSKENKYVNFEVEIPSATVDMENCQHDNEMNENLINEFSDIASLKEKQMLETPLANGYDEVINQHVEPVGAVTEINGSEDMSSFVSQKSIHDFQYVSDNQKPLILIVDDNKDIIFMLTDLLSENYRIVNASNGENALEILKQEMPGLIITDIMMPGSIDGIKLVQIIREDQFFKHLPIIIISAKNSTQNKVEGLNAGADAYFTKPFDFLLLKTTVERLIVNMENRKSYFNSSASAFDLDNGTPRHHEDTEFLSHVLDKIDKNMSNGNIDAAFIAQEMGYSYQTFYRKFKTVSSLSPGDFIKKRRFAYAAKLLLTTNLSIQEVIYKVGISNRSYFYRDFSKIYGMTPKSYREANREINSPILNSNKSNK